jgi:diacylglycerol kinase (ATP)
MASVLQDQRNVLHVITDGPDSVPEVLTRFATEGVDVLVVNGGDGTLQQVLTLMLNNAIFSQLPMVAALRGGRTNMSAIDFGCQRDSAKALASLIEAARSGTLADRMVDRPVLRMDLGPEDGIQFGMFFAHSPHKREQLT